MSASAAVTVVEPNPDGHSIEYTYLSTEPDLLIRLLTDLFENHWSEIFFGPCIQGAVFEYRAQARPRISLLDGYMTIDFGDWHCHLCIGPHEGSPRNPTPPEIAAWRRASKAGFFRHLNQENAPTSWGIRLWNGRDEQMITFFLPNPYYDEQMHRQKPDWGKLELWNRLRANYADLPPDAPGPETELDPHQ
jgi:hypothetical protein